MSQEAMQNVARAIAHTTATLNTKLDQKRKRDAGHGDMSGVEFEFVYWRHFHACYCYGEAIEATEFQMLKPLEDFAGFIAVAVGDSATMVAGAEMTFLRTVMVEVDSSKCYTGQTDSHMKSLVFDAFTEQFPELKGSFKLDDLCIDHLSSLKASRYRVQLFLGYELSPEQSMSETTMVPPAAFNGYSDIKCRTKYIPQNPNSNLNKEDKHWDPDESTVYQHATSAEWIGVEVDYGRLLSSTSRQRTLFAYIRQFWKQYAFEAQGDTGPWTVAVYDVIKKLGGGTFMVWKRVGDVVICVCLDQRHWFYAHTHIFTVTDTGGEAENSRVKTRLAIAAVKNSDTAARDILDTFSSSSSSTPSSSSSTPSSSSSNAGAAARKERDAKRHKTGKEQAGAEPDAVVTITFTLPDKTVDLCSFPASVSIQVFFLI
jgi:hypothetical protein